MKIFLVMVTMLLLSISFVSSQERDKQTSNNSKAEQEILQMEKEWNDARAKTDRVALERLIAKDFVTFNQEGEEIGKERIVKNFRTPNLEAIENGNVKVRVFGDTAIATGWNIRDWIIMDRETSPQEWFTNVWVKRDGKWQIISNQGSAKKEHPFNSTVGIAALNDSELKPVTALGCEQEPSLKSLKSDTPTAIKFTNSLNQPVNIYWLNYQGKRDQKGYFLFSPFPAGNLDIVALPPNRSVAQNTFLTHPFLVTDAKGKCLGIYQPSKEPGHIVIK